MLQGKRIERNYDTELTTLKDKDYSKFELAARVVERTKGKANTAVLLKFVEQSTLTEDDLVAIFNKYERGDSYGDCKIFRDKKIRDGKSRKAHNAQKKFKYKFEDTFVSRAYQKYVPAKFANEIADTGWGSYNHGYDYSVEDPKEAVSGNKLWNSGGDKLMNLKLFAVMGKKLSALVGEDPYLGQVFKNDKYISPSVGWACSEDKKKIFVTDKEWVSKQIEIFARSMEATAHIPKSERPDKDEDDSDNNYKFSNQHSIFYAASRGFRTFAREDNIMLTEDALTAMKYVGVAIRYDHEVYRNGRHKLGYKCPDMFRRLAGLTRKFTIDVKKGFAPQDVRELLVEDFNAWADKNDCAWKLCVRDDAKNEYEDLMPKKNKNKKGDK